MAIAICGSIATDHLMRFEGKFSEQLLAEHLDHISLSFLVEDLVVRRGGVGGNISYGLGVLGAAPMLVGAVGSDFDEYREWLTSNGVDCSGVRTSRTAHTARFMCTTDDDMAQLASFYVGAMADARQISLSDLADEYGRPEIVLIGADDPVAMVQHSQSCRDLEIPFAADPSQQLALLDGDQIRSLIDGAEFLFTNEYEWGLLQKKTGLTADEVAGMVTTRVTTLGGDGADIVGKDGTTVHVDVVPAKEKVDPTGVGDGFRAGFLFAQQKGLSFERGAQLGALIATSVLETVAPQDWSWDRDTALARIEETYGADAAAEIGAVVP
ncbi:carbohydrate kinase family protein [Williamsia deligens]|uniref:Carbohydrate kinase family protein n=1 Tax=Williamsia deligens TaxID=321325 RepID=A0ABW3GDE0_9NOCA|nr:carbohydrate kinase family protein [Williamsia deligens]MCP2195819.1 adenosine kinase [Williamsia deligens]